MRRVINHNIAECAALLGRLEPGFLPEEIFSQVARLVRLPMVDLIPIRREGSSWSIGLVQRDEDDTWWPGIWHLPGTYLRSTDTLQSAFSRLRKEELSLVRSGIPTFCGVSILRRDSPGVSPREEEYPESFRSAENSGQAMLD